MYGSTSKPVNPFADATMAHGTYAGADPVLRHRRCAGLAIAAAGGGFGCRPSAAARCAITSGRPTCSERISPMSAEIPAEALQLRSLVRADQILELFLDMVRVSDPGPDEVVIRVEAAPLNPSDMGLLFGGADMAAAVASGSAERPVVTAPIPDAAMRGLAGRVGTPMPVGNEGAGTVVAAGESPAARALLGKVVAAAGGGMYSQYRSVNVALCLELPAGATAIEGAASFVNPMTVLGMVETMRMENHSADRKSVV